ncbi:MAG: energy transducer TonB [Duncaniella sp.]|nr:energy transducer TonB [Duncaniella sp.]
MTQGKHTCKMLKQIRQKIAEENGIEFVTQECTFKGDCSGTCPKCEAEVLYLERQLHKRLLSGKTLAIAGISAGIFVLASCSPSSTSMQYNSETTEKNVGNYNTKRSNYVEIEDFVLTGEYISDEDNDSARTKHEEFIYDPDAIYEISDEAPKFPDGIPALLKFISKNVHFPEHISEDIKFRRVVVKFVVMKDGNIGDVQILRSCGDEFDIEAIRVVKLLPKFEPGKIDGQNINRWYTLPIDIKRPEK